MRKAKEGNHFQNFSTKKKNKEEIKQKVELVFSFKNK